MTTIKIKDKELDLNFTIASWKKLKEINNLTPFNFEEKLQEDTAASLSALIYYGLSPEARETVTQEDVDASLDFSVIDTVSEAIMKGLPKSSKKVAEENDEESGTEKK